MQKHLGVRRKPALLLCSAEFGGSWDTGVSQMSTVEVCLGKVKRNGGRLEKKDLPCIVSSGGYRFKQMT